MPRHIEHIPVYRTWANPIDKHNGLSAKNIKSSPRSESGITLIELTIIIMIVSMVAAITYPSYKQPVLEMHRAAAQNLLLEILEKQQNFYAQNKTYTRSLDKLGYALKNNEVETLGWRYSITATNCTAPLSEKINHCVQLIATAQDSAKGDSISINSAGWKTPSW